MCLAKAYLKGTERDELFLEEVALVRMGQGKLSLRTLFGEEKEIEAVIREIDFMKSSILLEKRQ